MRATPPLQSRPGTYILVLRAASRRAVAIGRLATLELRPGFYLYVGSACGPGGVRARLAHHLCEAPRPRWHVDYLRAHARPVELWCRYGPERREHDWAEALRSWPATSIPLAGFGSSDCRCPSHLFASRGAPRFLSFGAALRQRVSGDRLSRHRLEDVAV